MSKFVKKLLSVNLIVLMIFSGTVSVFADESITLAAAEESVEEEDQKQAEEAAKAEAEKKAAEEAAKAEAEKKAAEEAAKAEAEKKAAEEAAKAETEAPEQEEAPESQSAPEEETPQEAVSEPEQTPSEDDAAGEEAHAAAEAKNAKPSKLKLKADLTDGTYKPESFDFSGGTGKAKVTCDKVIIKNGEATAVFTASSDLMTHFYMGAVSSNAEDKSLFDPSTGKRGKDVYKITDKEAYVPVTLDQQKPFCARTTAMSEPHWVQYYYTLSLGDSPEKISNDTTIPEEPEDEAQQSGLSDGTYKPDAFDFSGGTGKASVSCDKVIIKGGKATAVFTASSDLMTHFYMGSVSSNAEDKSLYDPSTGATGSGVYAISNKSAYVPVALNEEKPFCARTTAMSEPHWVQYYYKVTLGDNAEKISDDTTIPGEQSSDEETEPEEEAEPTDTKELKDGTYKVNATTDRKMFYLYPKEQNPAKVILVKKNGKMTATITLTGDGYDYVYMGTPAQAKKAGKSKWIKYKKVNGYYTFKIPVSKLDKKLPITPHSSKYESDGDPSTDPWRPDKWIIFYSKGAKKVKDGSSIATKKKSSSDNEKTSGKQTKFKNDKKAAKESKYKDDSGKSTSAVNNSTGLKDGVYTPDRFSWSGGSGRLSYIRCNKITVKGGKAYATIEFGSSKYDSLKASGHVYSKSGGGNSKFTIPVKLNANNTIIGRTTAMSQPHWVKYTIFIYKKGADAKGGSNKKAADGEDGHVTNTKKLTSKAPDLMGLEFKEELKVENAKYFKIYKYEQGIILIEIDQAGDTALYRKETDKDSKDKDKNENADDNQGNIEYDDEGNPIARSQNEITDDLYHNNIINYLVVPDGAEIPAGLDKDCIVIQQPVEKGYVASQQVLDVMEQLGVLKSVKSLGMEAGDVKNDELKEAVEAEDVQALGSYEKPDYASLIKAKTDLAVFPDDVLPETAKDGDEAAVKESEEKAAALEVLQRRFSALAVPMIVDRSGDEKDNYAEAEWIKVYGVVFGKEKEAEEAFDKYKKDNKKKAKKNK